VAELEELRKLIPREEIDLEEIKEKLRLSTNDTDV